MLVLVLWLIPLACVASMVLTWLVRGVSRRAGAFDSTGVPGQVKLRRPVPNTGGIAIAATLIIPLGLGLVGARWLAPYADKIPTAQPPQWLPAELLTHLPGVWSEARAAGVLIACLLWLHMLGLIDDRRPLGPVVKLFAMTLPALAAAWIADTRLLTLLDAHAGGSWASIALTVLWTLAVTNAMNFMDNMDGLSGGVGVACAACLLAGALGHGQWFVGAALALFVGALGGFLVFNFPWRRGEGGRASIFMGDGGSLVLGFLLAFLSVRMTYVSPHAESGPAWHAVLTPLVVLAVPLYDLLSVCVIRMRAGRSPMVGDQNHLSHRLVRLGLSKRAAVVVIVLFSMATALAGVILPVLDAPYALLLGLQVAMLLTVLAIFEWSHARGGGSLP